MVMMMMMMMMMKKHDKKVVQCNFLPIQYIFNNYVTLIDYIPPINNN